MEHYLYNELIDIMHSVTGNREVIREEGSTNIDMCTVTASILSYTGSNRVLQNGCTVFLDAPHLREQYGDMPPAVIRSKLTKLIQIVLDDLSSIEVDECFSSIDKLIKKGLLKG